MKINNLTIESAKEYALEKFKQLPELKYQWNIVHSKGMIKALDFLMSKCMNKEKLYALAWIHDIGKIISKENHTKLGLEILEKDFELDVVDKDCILNHGSSTKPETEEGKIFRYADGLSLFIPEVLNFRFYAEAKEGSTFEEIQEKIKKSYEKYKSAYSDSVQVVKLLDRLFSDVS